MVWRLLGSKIVFDNYMQVEERTYEMPDGRIKQFYIKVTKPAVCVLAITGDNQIITVEQFRPGPNQTLKELPGGYMEPGESPEQAAARELREETGYAGELQFITNIFEDAYSTMERTCFVATKCRKVSLQYLDDSEFIRVRLMPLPEFLQLVRAGWMTDVDVAMLGLDKLGLLEN